MTVSASAGPVESALQKLLELPDLDARLILSAVINKIRQDQPDYWRRLADEWEAATPRPGQFLGRATRAELSERWHSCLAIATACRHYAELLEEELEEAA
jgi:hypothetical protein